MEVEADTQSPRYITDFTQPLRSIPFLPALPLGEKRTESGIHAAHP